MVSSDKIKKITDDILNYSKADQTEVIIDYNNFGLSRFANSYIHQNMVIENFGLQIRTVFGKKIGVASTNNMDEVSIRKTVDNACGIAKLSREDKDFKSLPNPTKTEKVKSFYPETQSFGPIDREQEIEKIINKSSENNLTASGAFSSGVNELVVANSLGIFEYIKSTDSSLNIVVLSPTSSGYSFGISRNIRDIDSERLTEIACQKAILSQNPIEINPGEYEVVLEEQAVNEMIAYLSYLGWNPKAVFENKSFLSGKIGNKVFGENITIWDEGLNKNGLPESFDYEGVAKQKVMLIDKGVARNLPYDSYQAGIENKASTGHALPAPNTIGPITGHVFMKNGNTPKRDLIKGIKKGIWITKFHYVNTQHHKLLNITGMTKDGTFLIENGKITRPIKNLRFTQSIPEAFNNVVATSRETSIQESWIGGNVLPSLRIKKFNFTGRTTF
ncbi:MAG: hypothetical protein C0412_15810 [Flavobacterium sp.]|nr:hypothetical protein [Flavobacterium sp.]